MKMLRANRGGVWEILELSPRPQCFSRLTASPRADPEELDPNLFHPYGEFA